MYKKICSLFITIILIFTLSGCSNIDKLKVKMGFRNTRFDFMKEDEIQKLVIESNRDKGYRFIVTNKDVIKDVKEILSSAKEVNTKTQLEHDYILEIHENNGKIHKYNYVAGLDKKDGGNLYSEDNKSIFIVSSRLDNDILNSFENIRKPRKFKDVYYVSIMDTLKKYLEENKDLINNKTIGFNFNDDIDVQKFLLSLDMESFKESISKNYPMVKLSQDTSVCDYTLNVDTEGFTSTVYKAIIRFIDNKTTKEKKYYIWGNYNDSKIWEISINNKKPDGF